VCGVVCGGVYVCEYAVVGAMSGGEDRCAVGVHFKGGGTEEGEKTAVWTRRKKTVSQEDVCQDANGWVSTMPLPWLGDASRKVNFTRVNLR
jgi:hypothetical protein